MKTLKERYTAGLSRMDFVPVKTRSSKYEVFEGDFKLRDGSAYHRFLFLGTHGAIRGSDRNNAKDSFPLSEGLVKFILLQAAQAEKEANDPR